MSTTISVNKQNVKQFLESGKEKLFVIPEYQRPYAWTIEQVETLFEDLWEFASTTGGCERNGTYFLGSIVSYENENNEQEIIDGQQRITSLFLLLRAIYTKLQKDDTNNDSVKHFMAEIEPVIWKTDNATGKADYKKILLESRVISNEGNNILKDILETGKSISDAKDNYSKNYKIFQEMFDEYSEKYPLSIYDFIYTVLNQAIVLPIKADNQDTALTIFSTLNDRGLALSDSDIFKAKIYNNNKDSDKKKQFINKWKDLDERAKDVNESIQQLFYYYMFFIRANEKDSQTTTPGLRKYYSWNKFSRLYDENLMDNLKEILNVWAVINKREIIESEKWSKNNEILQALDILSSYPNEFWKYPIVIYYLTHKFKDGFEEKFLIFIRKLISVLLIKYLIKPTINAVRSEILQLNVSITESPTPKFNFKKDDISGLKENFKVPSRYIVQMILKILSYNKQKNLLPEKWEIEHILPRKNANSYFLNVKKDIIKEKIEHIGNKLPFEKKLNIQAGNGYFRKKKEKYWESKIVITNQMGHSNKSEWILEDIDKRDNEIFSEICNTLDKWDKEYKF